MFGKLRIGRRRRFIQPAALEHYRFVRVRRGVDCFEVWRDDRQIVGEYSGSDLAEITRRYAAEERHERATFDALRSGEPLALCRLGWHRLPNGVYVRYGAGHADAMRVYRMGRAPFDHGCTTIWAHNRPVLVCAVCRSPIDAAHGRGRLT